MPNILQDYLDGKGQPADPPPGTVPNSAGGASYPVTPWTQLERFLLMGDDGGTYYLKPFALTQAATTNVLRCLASDPIRVLLAAVEISQAGRARSNDPALYVLALGATDSSPLTRRRAFDYLPLVARTFTHLSHFLNYLNGIKRVSNRMRRTGVARWFTRLSPRDLAYQAIKYPQRDGWAMRDVLRWAHPPSTDPKRALLFEYIMRGWPSVGTEPHPDPDLRVVWASELLKQGQPGAIIEDRQHYPVPKIQIRPPAPYTPTGAAQLIRDYNIPREAVPTEYLQHKEVWEALALHMPITALLRNLGNLTAKGVYTNPAPAELLMRLSDAKGLRAGRVHPMAILVAGAVYAQGQGVKGNLKWTPIPGIQDALEDGFYASFTGVQPTGLRYYVGIDVSGSMGQHAINGLALLTPRNVATALALLWARTQTPGQVVVRAFSHRMEEVTIRRNSTLESVIRETSALPFNRTDCAQPMIDALARKESYDVFVILTDSEHYAGKIHPRQALRDYRQGMGLPARLVCVAMAANRFSVADPKDAGMLDVCGFDAHLPALIDGFVNAPRQPGPGADAADADTDTD